MPELADRIAELLAGAETPLTIPAIADRLEVSTHDVDRVIWGDPRRFAWQPGHCWTLGTEKPRPVAARPSATEDARARLWTPADHVQLRAITLASGVVLKVSRRPLDTHAFFSVKSAGNEVELILNSTHELFGEHPMPFEEEVAGPHYKRLLELLLEAWALYEDSIPGGSSRRAAEDIRLLWGRRATELLRDFTDGD